MSSDREVPQMKSKQPKEPTMEDVIKLYLENIILRKKLQEIQEDIARNKRAVENMIEQEINSIKKRRIE